MSDATPPPPVPLLSRRGGCATILMFLAGVILLLPGICSLLFTIADFADVKRYFDREVLVLVLIVAALAAAGIFLMITAVRRGRRP